MIAPRWRKVFKDLWGNKLRTVLVILAIAVGVFAIGFVTTSFEILMTDMDAEYQSANPHGAVIYTEPFGEEFLETLRRVPGVEQLEGRATLSGNILLGEGEKLQIGMLAIPPVNEIQIDKIRPNEPGEALVLGEHEIFIERSALAELQANPGDSLEIEVSDGRVRSLKVAAIVYDVSSIPFAFTRQVTGYVTPETLYWLGGLRDYNQIYLTVSERKTDEAYVTGVASEVADRIKRGSREVYATLVFQPGRHFAYDITQGLGALLGVMGILAVGLSAFLVVNTLNALLAQHVRQIGVMKAVGAKTGQLVSMYVVLVLCFGLVAFLFAVPLSAFAANVIAGGTSQYLNFNMGRFRVPPTTLVFQAAVAFIVPVMAALIPIWNGTRLTVREAISSYGLGSGHFGQSWFDRLLERIRALPRPLLISLRNTFRRKVRLLLTLSTLTLAGGIFIAVFNLQAAMNLAINETLGYILSDVNLSFGQAYRLQKIVPIAENAPGVVGVEGWAIVSGEVLTADRQASTQVFMFAPPAHSTLIDPTLTSGRWLTPDDENALVIGNHLLAQRPELKVGDEVAIKIGEKEKTWRIVGIYRMAGNVIPPIVYANNEYLTRTLGQINRASQLRISTATHDLQTQERVAKYLEARYREGGINLAGYQLGTQTIQQNTSQTDILVYFMLVMALLIAMVGGLGLMSTMAMNVIERTRELGVMRAIGASDRAIQQLVIVEGMMIGTISWILGAVLAIPVTMLMNTVVGVAFLQSALPFLYSWNGLVVWLVVVIVLSSLASFLPARNASRLTVREVLAYE